MRGGCWMTRTIQSGNVIEKSKFWVPSNTKARNYRTKKTVKRQRDCNFRNAIKSMARILNCNFSPADCLITLTVSGEHEDKLQSLGAEVRKFLRRMKRATGADTKWLFVEADKDGSTGESERPHCHMVITGTGLRFENGSWWAGKKKMTDLWTIGAVNVKNLFRQDDYTGLAQYLCAQAKCGENEKKWTSSRNMIKPIVRESITVQSGPIRVPKGAKLLHEGEWDIETGAHYIRYVKPEGRGKHELQKD